MAVPHFGGGSVLRAGNGQADGGEFGVQLIDDRIAHNAEVEVG